jgi:hypothetical protein
MKSVNFVILLFAFTVVILPTAALSPALLHERACLDATGASRHQQRMAGVLYHHRGHTAATFSKR